jgi:hypothetical protein
VVDTNGKTCLNVIFFLFLIGALRIQTMQITLIYIYIYIYIYIHIYIGVDYTFQSCYREYRKYIQLRNDTWVIVYYNIVQDAKNPLIRESASDRDSLLFLKPTFSVFSFGKLSCHYQHTRSCMFHLRKNTTRNRKIVVRKTFLHAYALICAG